MKKLGLVGGVGYMSTLEYYKGINEGYQKRINNPARSNENPQMVIESLNLAVAYDLVLKKDWQGFTDLFVKAIKVLHQAGAEIGAIAANTAHIVFDEIQKQSQIPLVGIVDETCKYAQKQECKRLIVFGTGFTMNSGMYEKKCAKYGMEAIVPNETDRKIIHEIIFPNLEAGIVIEREKEDLLSIAKKMIAEFKADALVLGCTELPLAIKAGDLDTMLIDTGSIHVEAILDAIL